MGYPCRYNVQIAALSETRLAREGQLKEIGAGYTLFWSGRNAKERRIRSGLCCEELSCEQASKPPHAKVSKQHATIISAYAPTMKTPDDVKERFYEVLDKLIRSVPRQKKTSS